MSDEPKRRVLSDNPSLQALNKCAKVLEGLTSTQITWILQSLTALYQGDLPDRAAKG